MKAIMYHYVRPTPARLPYFKYLHIDDFRRQLDWLAQTHPVVSREAFLEQLKSGASIEGSVLTFDDAFADHFHFVFPELKARGLWGVFYVPTGIFSSDRILDVHRIHLLLGSQGGETCIAALRELVTDDMLSHGHVEEYRQLTYRDQNNDDATSYFKRVLNYYISYEFRQSVLDKLMARFFPDGAEAELKKAFYLSPDQVREMHQDGMIVGSHSVNHFVMSKLDVSAQRREIESSFSTLQEITGSPTLTFCYPYGGFHSFTDDTEELLAQNGSLFSFNVEARDIANRDLTDRAQALPRYDCNFFPHGTAR